MASDRGAAPNLHPDDLDENWFHCDVLHVSGYSLLRQPIAAAAARAAELARAHGARVSLDLSTWALADDAYREQVHALAPDVVFANERERAAVGELGGSWVLKHGADGIVVDGESFAAHAGEIVDPTGAGDALAAGYLVGGAELGLAAAARCCSRLGTLP
jgi:sugar/nucleoside kinase (ribokinase family)